MHFVAESMTQNHEEFAKACQSAVSSLKPGGKFVASFMLSSEGYSTGSAEFPAVNLDGNAVVQTLAPMLENIDARELSFNVREGHEGMLSVTATRPLAETRSGGATYGPGVEAGHRGGEWSTAA